MITAVVKFRNEETFLGYCIESLMPHVDKILLVNNKSTDNSRLIAEKYVSSFVRLVDCDMEPGTKECSMADYYNWCTDQTDTKYILKFDGDAIALNRLSKYTDLMLTGVYDLICLYALNLYGDHKHVRTTNNGIIGNEPFLFDRKHRYERHPSGLAVIYKDRLSAIDAHQPTMVHMNIKSPEQYLLRKLHHQHRNLGTSQPLEEWAKENFDWNQMLRENEKEVLTDLSPYDGNYHDVLKPYLDNPRWVVEYEDGRPARRVQKW